MNLTELHEKYHKTCKCSLKKSATQPVFGIGNEKADIVFIGEAPGKNEDLQGKPFVGRAGKLLDEMLSAIKLERKDIYITNTVKYRPPNNRDPKPEEKSACLPWLVAELNHIKPKIIIPLGNHALQNLFPKETISKVRGKLIAEEITFSIGKNNISIPTTHYFPLYHPAAALYNGKLREVLLKDFKKIPNILKKI